MTVYGSKMLPPPVSADTSANSRSKRLIPHSHHDRATVARQVDEVRVSVATNISKTFLLKLAGTEIYGSPVRGQVSLSDAGGCLNLFMTEDCAAAECPPYELVRIVADACNIKDPNHYSLLYTALSNSSMENIAATFTQQGINVKGLVFSMHRISYCIILGLIWTQTSRRRDTWRNGGICCAYHLHSGEN